MCSRKCPVPVRPWHTTKGVWFANGNFCKHFDQTAEENQSKIAAFWSQWRLVMLSSVELILEHGAKSFFVHFCSFAEAKVFNQRWRWLIWHQVWKSWRCCKCGFTVQSCSSHELCEGRRLSIGSSLSKVPHLCSIYPCPVASSLPQQNICQNGHRSALAKCRIWVHDYVRCEALVWTFWLDWNFWCLSATEVVYWHEGQDNDAIR